MKARALPMMLMMPIMWCGVVDIRCAARIAAAQVLHQQAAPWHGYPENRVKTKTGLKRQKVACG